MSTFERCPESVNEMAIAILCEFETHKPLLDNRVKIDFVFARAEEDDKGIKKGNALSKNGVRALGIARAVSLKDRALGRADAEISLDGDWWDDANELQQRALLDHELHHLVVKVDKRGVVRDDLGRPVIQMRKHDFEFGWFSIVASRHGVHSMERIQAAQIMEKGGQFYWPFHAPKVERIRTEGGE